MFHNFFSKRQRIFQKNYRKGDQYLHYSKNLFVFLRISVCENPCHFDYTDSFVYAIELKRFTFIGFFFPVSRTDTIIYRSKRKGKS